LSPSKPALGCGAPLLRYSSLVQVNSTGAGLVTCRRSLGESPKNLKFHSNPNTGKRDEDNGEFVFPVIH